MRVRHYGEEARVEVPLMQPGARLPGDRLAGAMGLWQKIAMVAFARAAMRRVVADPRGFPKRTLEQRTK